MTTTSDALERLLANRRHVRSLLGATYRAKVGPIRTMLRQQSEASGTSIMKVALAASKAADADGQDVTCSLIMAAACDEIEAGP